MSDALQNDLFVLWWQPKKAHKFFANNVQTYFVKKGENVKINYWEIFFNICLFPEEFIMGLWREKGSLVIITVNWEQWLPWLWNRDIDYYDCELETLVIMTVKWEQWLSWLWNGTLVIMTVKWGHWLLWLWNGNIGYHDYDNLRQQSDFQGEIWGTFLLQRLWTFWVCDAIYYL